MGNNTFVGFLDTSQAFDTVWRKDLMYKLHKLGITGKMWTLIDDCHINTESCIVVNQTQSRQFWVNQGVRQLTGWGIVHLFSEPGRMSGELLS